MGNWPNLNSIDSMIRWKIISLDISFEEFVCVEYVEYYLERKLSWKHETCMYVV